MLPPAALNWKAGRSLPQVTPTQVTRQRVALTMWQNDREIESKGMKNKNMTRFIFAHIFFVFLFLPVFAHADSTAPVDDFNVRTFGAIADGKHLDTAAINKAIDAAHTAGGGTVRFPAGTYLSVSIHLQSNIALYLDPGGIITAAKLQDGAAYDAPEPNAFDAYQDFGHSHWHNSLIWGEDLENVSILGPGLIHGVGLSDGFWSRRAATGPPKPPRLKPARQPKRLRTPPPPPRKAPRRERELTTPAIPIRAMRSLSGSATRPSPQELPQRHAPRRLDPARRPLRHPRHRRRQPHDRQPQDRHQPRRHGHRLLPQRPRLQLQRQFALRTTASASRARYGLGYACADGKRHDHQLLVSADYDEGTLLDGTVHSTPAATRQVAAHRPHQVRHRIQRRLQEHHDLQLRLR